MVIEKLESLEVVLYLNYSCKNIWKRISLVLRPFSKPDLLTKWSDWKPDQIQGPNAGDGPHETIPGPMQVGQF